MFYNGDNPVLRVLDVCHMKWDRGSFDVKPREHSALSFRIKGDGKICANGNEYKVGAGEILYIPQNMGYKAEYTETEMIVIHFVTAEDGKDIEVYSFDMCEDIYKGFMQSLAIWNSKQAGYRVFALSTLYKILGTLLEKVSETKLPPHFRKAVSYINSNYRDVTLTVPLVCKHAGISETVLRELFRLYFKKTPVSYITDMRIEYARSLISNGETVEAASYKSGFRDSKYFARTIKKRLGCTPRELKNYGK